MVNNPEFLFILLFVIAIGLIIVINLVFISIKNKNSPVYNYYENIKKVSNNNKQDKSKIKLDGTLIGESGRRAIYTPDNAKHIFICGTTGSGKTVALSNYIKRASEKGFPSIIVDGKGDINSDSILDITKRLSKGKIYVINLTRPEQSDKYNPFLNTSPTVCKDMLINLTNWSEEHYKLNTERYLQKVITLMNMADIPLSFDSIIKYTSADMFVKLSLDLRKNDLLTKEEHLNNAELAKTSGRIAESATARFSLLAESELGTIFHENGVDISTALAENAVILFILNPLLYPETSSLMGRLVMVDSKKAVSHRFNNNQRSFFIFDEINTYASSVLIDLVNKSRSANVTCILATQSLSDLDFAVNEDFKEQVIENCNNYILLRQNSAKNAEAWANIIGTQTAADTTYQLSDKSGRTEPTGMGTIKFNKQFIFHPDEIKNLKQGQAFFVSKDTGQKVKISIHKPF